MTVRRRRTFGLFPDDSQQSSILRNVGISATDGMKKHDLQYALHVAMLGGLVVAGMKYINGDGLARALSQFDGRYASLFACLVSATFWSKDSGLFA